MLKLALIVPVLGLCLIRYAAAFEFVNVDYPAGATAGSTVRVTITTQPADPLEIKYGCADQVQGPYRLLSAGEIGEKKKERPCPEALTGSACKQLQFSPPAGQNDYFFWVRGDMSYLTLRGYRGENQLFEKTMGNKNNGWRWLKLRWPGNFGDFERLALSASDGNGIDGVWLSRNSDFDPRPSEKEGSLAPESNVFALKLPQTLTGELPIKVWAQLKEERIEQIITIKIDPAVPEVGARLPRAGGLEWFSLGAAANLSVTPEGDLPKVIDPASLNQSTLAWDEGEYVVPAGEKAFVAVWMRPEVKEEKKPEAGVAQADDKIKGRLSLPAEAEVAVKGRYPALVFLQAEAGAGEYGDHLWSYEVNYAGGQREEIRIREGEQVYGLMKGQTAEAAREVWSGLVDNSPAKVYAYTWLNPHPDQELRSIRILAVRPKIVPVLLGVAGAKQAEPPAVAAPQAADGPVAVEVNLLKPVRPVRPGLFSINNPNLADSGGELARSDESWRFYAQLGFPWDRIWLGKLLPDAPDKDLALGQAFEQYDLAARRMAKETKTRIILNLNPPKWGWDEAADLDARQERLAGQCVELVGQCLKNGWPLGYVELFNETLIRHPAAEVKRKYACFNRVAAALKKAYPEIKIAGTAECWPAVEVLERFMQNCGQNTDALSWHLYPTGDTKTATEAIMGKTGQFAESSRLVQKMLKKHFPDREIPQLITELNINYAAWLNGGESRQKNGIGAVWLLSVLGHLLYDGEAEVANYWHYAFDSCYSVGTTPGWRPTPVGTAYWLLNRYFRGQLCQVGCGDKALQAIAADNGTEYALAVLNVSGQERTARLRLLNLPAVRTGDDLFPVKSYAVQGEEKTFVSTEMPAQPFAGGGMELTLPPFSAQIYILPQARAGD